MNNYYGYYNNNSSALSEISEKEKIKEQIKKIHYKIECLDNDRDKLEKEKKYINNTHKSIIKTLHKRIPEKGIINMIIDYVGLNIRKKELFKLIVQQTKNIHMYCIEKNKLIGYNDTNDEDNINI